MILCAKNYEHRFKLLQRTEQNQANIVWNTRQLGQYRLTKSSSIGSLCVVLIGPVGPPGDTGPTGPPGPVGFAGAVGITGATGSRGPAGPEFIESGGVAGPGGATGSRGDPGRPGKYFSLFYYACDLETDFVTRLVLYKACCVE